MLEGVSESKAYRCRIAQTGMVSSVDSLEVTEDQGELLKVQRRQLLVRAVQRVGDSMRE